MIVTIKILFKHIQCCLHHKNAGARQYARPLGDARSFFIAYAIPVDTAGLLPAVRIVYAASRQSLEAQ